ncbi:MAG TPA: calcium/sodium antiporter [Acidobacteriota bacterium]|nr:calcium/sodium antiporter [Acidobacteriota bacterium]
MTTLFFFILGLLLLIWGAEWMVRGSIRLAARLGISPLIIGLTVVAFGTSSPELAVVLRSSLIGSADISIGNVVGSNIFNVLIVLGASAVVAPLTVSGQLIRSDVPVMILASFATFLFCLDGRLSTTDAVVLVLCGGLYVFWLIRASKKQNRVNSLELPSKALSSRQSSSLLPQIGLVIFGIFLLAVGAKWLVDSAMVFAQVLGVSELVVGLTIVAGGTSLPEVATSVLAAFKGERDLAVGNVVGSNLFNIFLVLGVAGIISPGGIPVSPAAIYFDFPVMLAVAVACLPIFFTGNVISRWEGAVFLGYYVAYALYLFLASSDHDALASIYSTVMLLFVLPITALTLAVVTWRAIRRQQTRI